MPSAPGIHMGSPPGLKADIQKSARVEEENGDLP